MAMLEIEKARGFTLPDGAHLEVEAFSGALKAAQDGDCIWKSLDISLVGERGYRNLLCSIDYEEGKGLRVLTYDKGRDNPVSEKYVGYGPETIKDGEGEEIPLF